MSTRWLAAPALNCRITIGQRLHVDDTPGHELDEGAVGVVLPMNFDPSARCSTRFGSDPRTEEGELLHPARFPADRVSAIRRALGGIASAAQLDQHPVPAGGAIFKREMLAQRWTAALPWDAVVISADCAFKGTAQSDYVAIQAWARKGPNFYLLDQIRGRLTFSETLRAIQAMTGRYRGAPILIEDAANGPAVIDTLKKTIPGILAVKPAGGKEARANAVEHLFAGLNIFLPELPWVEFDYVPELLAFPRGRNDDQVDATTQALSYLIIGCNYLAGFADALARR
jgi:predicted phage terminase large subunit-like protein